MKRRVCAWAVSFFLVAVMLLPELFAQAEVIHEADLEDYILNEMSEAHVMSMGISIVSPEREAYCASYGSETKTDGDYVLGELTQSFTAAAIMHLSEEHELALDDTLGKYLSEEAFENVRSVTLRELLNQTSGISMYERMSALEGSGTRGSFEAAPANYDLLGKVIEKVSGVSFEEYVADNILDPLQMESTHSLRNDGDFLNDLVPGFRSYFGVPFEVQSQYDEEEDWMQVPAGLMISDVKDMGRYLQMYLQNGGDILSESAITTMLGGEIPTEQDSDQVPHFFDGSVQYGMGWYQTVVNGKTIYYHTGKSDSSTTAMFLLPEQKLGVVLLFNTVDYFKGQEMLEKLIRGIISIELGENAEAFHSENYLRQYIMIDIGLALLLLAAWMPIILIGVWGRRRRKRVWNAWGILLDCTIHLGLPTVLLLWVQRQMPFFYFRRIYPDIFYVFLVMIGTLYLGAVIKLIATVVFAILGPKEDPEEQDELDSENKEPAQNEVNGDSANYKGENDSAKQNDETDSVKQKNENGSAKQKDEGDSNSEQSGSKQSSPVPKAPGQKVSVQDISVKDAAPKEMSVPKTVSAKTVEAKDLSSQQTEVKEVKTKHAEVTKVAGSSGQKGKKHKHQKRKK